MSNKNKKNDSFLKTMLRLFTYFKGYRFLLFIVVILVIISALANILGTYMSKNVINYLTEHVNDEKAVQLQQLSQIILPLLFLYIAGVVSNIIYMQVMVHLTQKVLYNVRKDLFAKMQCLPIKYFDTHTHGEIMSYFTNDVDTIVQAINDSFANIVLASTNIIGTITSMFLLSYKLTFIILPLIIGLFFFMYFNTKATRKYFVLQQQALSEVNSKVEENLAGVKVEKAFNHEEDSMNDFLVSNDKWRKAAQEAYFHTQLTIPVNVSVSYINFALSAVIGCFFVANGSLLYGNFSSYLVFVRNVCQPFNFFTMHMNAILTCAAGSKRIFNFLDEEVEKDEGTVVLYKTDDKEDSSFSSRYCWKVTEKDGSTRLVPLVGKIEFNDVCFSYIKGKPILKHISFEAYPGKKVAFVGSTGAGKTTIISLLARFYPLDSGEILYDGININDIKLESLRRAISMVTQETHLFTGTIEDNIRYVRRHSSEEEVIQASKNSHSDSFIRRTPNGYKTMLFDDGSNLSEGQRQLLGITRASLNQPPVMILDEATSNIDTHSEQLIQEGLNKLMQNKTVMVIAHRLSTIRDANEIIVLDKGTIIERGTEKELLALKGAYYDLYTGKKELA